MIVGAGLAGLIAAHIFPQMEIFEAAPEPLQLHQALLRFRSDVVSNLTGIPFRKVMVRKGLYYNSEFVPVSIMMANLYTTKCFGRLVGERSIWNLEPCERYIAPDDFYEQMVTSLASRIHWGMKFYFGHFQKEPTISTAPLPVVLESVGEDAHFKAHYNVQFLREPITVWRFKILNADVHQTIYYPHHRHSMYRASITGDTLIVEFAGEPRGSWLIELESSFALPPDSLKEEKRVEQKYGKILPIDEGYRKRLVHSLSVQHNIYSLGRFATWRNLLLDDVVGDAAVIKRLLVASDYERKLISL